MYQIREQVSHYRLVTMRNQPQSTKRKKHKLSVLIGELGKTCFTDELVAGRILVDGISKRHARSSQSIFMLVHGTDKLRVPSRFVTCRDLNCVESGTSSRSCLQISVSSREDSDQWAATEPYSLIQDIVSLSSSNFDCQAETVDSMPFR